MGGFRAASLLLLAACAAPVARPGVEDRLAGGIGAILQREFGAIVRPLPRNLPDVAALRSREVVVIIADAPRVPCVEMDAAAREGLRVWVRDGGSLLLLGYATRLVYELGIEPVAPDRHELYRWGVSEATAVGNYRFGFRPVHEDVGPLLHGLRPEPNLPETFLVGGGDLAEVQSCQWEAAVPSEGQVLGSLNRIRDGELAQLAATAVVVWPYDKGRVLAYGSVPEPWREGERVGENAERLVSNAVRWLAGERQRPEVVLCRDVAPGNRVPARLARLAERPVPGRPLAAHWGWQVAINDQRDRRSPISPGQVHDQVLRPAQRAGADLLALRLADPDRGYPFAWPREDPIVAPGGYRAHGEFPSWTAATVGGLAGQARALGMLTFAHLDPPLVSGGTPLEQLAALKWFGRELLDPRLHRERALDGVGLDEWFRDAQGNTADVVATASPRAVLYQVTPSPSPARGAVGTVDARFGRPGALNAAGISAAWRDAHRSHDTAVLDCRARRPSSLWSGESGFGGGSYGDWIVTQVNDFVRPRLDRGAGFWWNAHNPALLSPQTLAYVHGVSMEPIKAAVAARSWSTGAGGYRDQVRAAAAGAVQSGFGAETPLPAHVPFLQNNHFRLYGSGGPLWIDPSGLADFDRPRARKEIARRFMRTRLRGARPDVGRLQRRAYDFVGGAPRGSGGFESTARVVFGAPEGAGIPARLAREDTPRWPRRVELSFTPEPGSYVLEMTVRAVAGDGVLELWREGELIRIEHLAESGGSVSREVPFAVVRSGAQHLALEIVDGGVVAIDVLRLRQRMTESGVTDMLAARTMLGDRAGHRAEIIESSGASFFEERLTWSTIADFAGFSVVGETLRAARNLDVRRSFELRGYDNVLTAADEHPGRLRSPFVLTASKGDLPDLAVVPVELPRYHWFSFDRENGLLLHARPRAHERFRLGFLFLRDYSRSALPHLRAVFDDLQDPRSLNLAADRPAELLSDLPIAWPRVVRVVGEGGPYRVRERGAWVVRGGQPTTAGCEWLRVYQFPGAAVKIESGRAVLEGTRPGPGSQHCIALRTPNPDSVTVEVHALGALLGAPSVVLGAAFDQLTINGQPWDYADGQTVYLPRKLGTYAVTARAGPPSPRLAATTADVRACAYDPRDRTLTVQTAPRQPGSDRIHTAWIVGPPAAHIDGATLVSDDEQHYWPEQRAAAAQRGFLIRHVAGTFRIRF